MPLPFSPSLNNTIQQIQEVISDSSINATQAQNSALQIQTAAGLITAGINSSVAFSEQVSNIVSATDIVATYVYDTRLDSDGGLWTERCAGTSWYREELNTATRGSKRSFPKVALLVLRNTVGTSCLRIYDVLDLDSSGAPRMWMIFSAGLMGSSGWLLSSIFALNGRIYVTSSNSGLNEINFISDTSFLRRGGTVNGTFRDNIARRNLGSFFRGNGSGILPGDDLYSVHARVLPGSLIDTISNMPIPTVAIASLQGLVLLHPNGSAVTQTASSFQSVQFVNDGIVRGGFLTSNTVRDYPIFYANTNGGHVASFAGTTGIIRTQNSGIPVLAEGALGSTTGGLQLLQYEQNSPDNSMICNISTDFNTGWLPGDIRGAWLNRGIVGVARSTEVIVNGNAQSGNFSSWITDTGSGGSVSVNAGQFELNAISATTPVRMRQSVSTIPGESYKISLNLADSSLIAFVRDSAGLDIIPSIAIPVGNDVGVSFIATSYTTNIWFNRSAGAIARLSNISCRLASSDHSHRMNGLAVNGELNRNLVAPGSELVSWSGFSSNNFLEQAYSSNMDFGTGDFSILAWVKTTSTNTTDTVVWRQDPAGSGPRFALDIISGGFARFISGSNVISSATLGSMADGTWKLIAGIRRSGITEIWVDGVRATTGSDLGNLNNSSAILRCGIRTDGTNSANPSMQISLLRISGYAPTPSQLRRIFRDERQLFRTNSKCFLAGSRNINSMSRSRFNGRLYVATTAGISIFDGFRRVESYDNNSLQIPILNSNIRSVSAESGFTGIVTGNNVGTRREFFLALDRVKTTSAPFRVRTMRATGFTNNATPLILSPRIFINERETIAVLATFIGRTVGSNDGQRIVYRRLGVFFRNAGGNVTLQGAVENLGTDTEVTASADGTLVIDTSSNTIGAQVTGVASTTIQWQVRFDIERNSTETWHEEVDA